MKSESSYEFKNQIKQLLHKVAFIEYVKEKSQKSKQNQLYYKSLQLQPYQMKKYLAYKEIYLLYSPRTRAHPVKNNHRKMHNNQILFTFGCLRDENQQHIF